jgi:hypothetical protein
MSKDGGPAFPVAPQFDERRGEYTNYGSDGMSLRDYFAAHCPVQWSPCVSWKAEAEFRYAYAAAMLAERSKP